MTVVTLQQLANPFVLLTEVAQVQGLHQKLSGQISLLNPLQSVQ